MSETKQGVQTSSGVWGSFELAAGGRGRWEIGPLSLWVERTDTAWVLASEREHEPLDERASHEPAWSEPPPDKADRIRCAVGSAGSSLVLSPALADRPIVVKPEQPFMILAGDEAVFYVGSPLWLRIQAGAPLRTLLEGPSLRLSDTWFGSSTREGELCYAAKTRARMALSEIPRSTVRALTRVHMHNRGAETLHFTRLKIPIKQLSLFVAADGRHWTPGLSVDCDAGGDEVEVRVEDAAPAEAGVVRRVAEPRESSAGVFRRTLAALVG